MSEIIKDTTLLYKSISQIYDLPSLKDSIIKNLDNSNKIKIIDVDCYIDKSDIDLLNKIVIDAFAADDELEEGPITYLQDNDISYVITSFDSSSVSYYLISDSDIEDNPQYLISELLSILSSVTEKINTNSGHKIQESKDFESIKGLSDLIIPGFN